MTPDNRTGDTGRAIAVDLGATNLRVGLVTTAGHIEQMSSVELPKDLRDATIITDLIIQTIHSLVPDHETGTLAGIGIGAAGPVDKARRAIVHPPNIPLETIPLSGPIGDEFGLPARLVNDCCAGLLGEAYFGEGTRSRNFVYVTMSTGIGAGIISNGTIISGRDGNAGEIGHLFVDNEYDLTCGCGGKGHWEGYASGRFLPRFYHEWRKRNVSESDDSQVSTAGDIFSAVRQGRNPGFVDELGKINARGISGLVVAYDPDTIVLDGSVVLNNPDLIITPIGRYVDHYLPVPRITVSSLSGLAPLLGASVIARGYDTRFGSVE
ncbi:MAG: ROK family protein [Methanoregula sp.]|uniref:ROK family protein n=1 Tax=Methanoregula sp. TaxID=2052170 RepID=UPI0025F63B18|nr:ROK family protein [Methanoregula sp.]MCK9632517.1 ROK family protein [Methanoregula sp.]